MSYINMSKEEYTQELYPLNSKFIGISNEYVINKNVKTFEILTVIGYDYISMSKQYFPIFEDENGKKIISGSIEMPYTKELEDILTKLTQKEAYTLLRAGILHNTELNQLKYCK